MYLTRSRAAKMSFLSVMYLAQGLPWGFVSVALTGYMYEQGFSTGEVGTLLAMAMWPWPFKWALGPIVDRWSIVSMGRRRPWIILAQTCMAISTLTIISLPDITSTIRLLGIVLMLHNCFVALQDVGVDALAVDILKAGEREKANAVMFASSHIGTFLGSAGLGYLIGAYSLHAGLWVLAGMQIAILSFPLLMRERAGEKLLPWTKGHARAELVARENVAVLQLARRVARAFSLRSTILGVVLAATVMVGMMMTTLIFQRFVIQDVNPQIFSMEGNDEVMAVLDRGEIPQDLFETFASAGYDIGGAAETAEEKASLLRLFSSEDTERTGATLQPDAGTERQAGDPAEWTVLFGNTRYIVKEAETEWTVHRGWTQAGFSIYMGTTVFTIVVAALFGGFLGSRLGVRRTAGMGTVLLGGTWILFAFVLAPDASDTTVVLFMHVDQFFTGLLTVALWAMFMQISWPLVAATQFTAYMAMLNVSRIVGSQFAGASENYMENAAWASRAAEHLQIESVPFLILVAGLIQIAVLVIIVLIDPTQTRRVLGDVNGGDEENPKEVEDRPT